MLLKVRKWGLKSGKRRKKTVKTLCFWPTLTKPTQLVLNTILLHSVNHCSVWMFSQVSKLSSWKLSWNLLVWLQNNTKYFLWFYSVWGQNSHTDLDHPGKCSNNIITLYMDFAVIDWGRKRMVARCAVLAGQKHRGYWFTWSQTGRRADGLAHR